jgi:septal ring factor EnvC (AmiA/AmiB activator)
MYRMLCLQAGDVFARLSADTHYQFDKLSQFTLKLLADEDQGAVDLEQHRAEIARLQNELNSAQLERAQLESVVRQQHEQLEIVHTEFARSAAQSESAYQALRSEFERVTHQAETYQRTQQKLLDELTAIRRSLIFRFLTVPIWKLRQRILPDKS